MFPCLTSWLLIISLMIIVQTRTSVLCSSFVLMSQHVWPVGWNPKIWGKQKHILMCGVKYMAATVTPSPLSSRSSSPSVFCRALSWMGGDGRGRPGSREEQCRCEQLHQAAVLLQEWHQRHGWHLGRGERAGVVEQNVDWTGSGVKGFKRTQDWTFFTCQ